MALFKRKKQEDIEARSIENPQIPITSQALLEYFDLGSMSAAGVEVSLEKAYGVPAVWAAVQFISGTIASLPLNVYKKSEDSREKMKSGIQTILHDAPNDETTSFDWRKYLMERVLTGGRSITYIERSGTRIVNLFSIDPSKVTVKRQNGRKIYVYKSGNAEEIVYKSSEIIDIPFALASDGLSSLSPIMTNKDAIGLMIAATDYGSRLFNNGGVPPFVIQGNYPSGKAMRNAKNDLEQAVKNAAKERGLALALPIGHELKTVGIDPEKSQLVELKRFQIEEIARIYSLPPVFLQDLTHGTFSNTEQQDLHLVKHTIRRWVTQIEQELNLKLFGRSDASRYVEFNVDGLLRGDFATRMSGYATAIQNAILKPDEARSRENLESAGGEADKLHIQGATVPLGSQTNVVNEAEPEPETDEDDEPEGQTDE